MAQYWIDVLDSYGVKQGDGPITTVTDWTHTANLDRAGTFSFTMPADDPRRSLLRIKRQVRCWTVTGGALQMLGQGIINDVTQIMAVGQARLQVSGDDLLHELTYRNVGDLTLQDRRWEHPALAMYVPMGSAVDAGDDSTNRTYLDFMTDYDNNDTTTWHSFDDNMEGRWLIFKHPVPFKAMWFTVRTISRGGSYEFYHEYWNGTAWTATGVTASPGGPFWGATNYYINWESEPASDWVIRSGEACYKVRIRPVGLEAGIEVSDVLVYAGYPDTAALEKIMTYAPAGWSLDAAQGYTSIANATEYGDNIVTRPSFEVYTGTQDDGISDTFEGWTVSGASDTAKVEATATAIDGANAVKITNGAKYDGALILQNMPAESATQYRFSAMVRGDGNFGPTYLIMTDKGSISPFVFTQANGTDYQLHEYDFTVPPGNTEIILLLCGPWYLDTGTGYWDNVSIRPRLGGEVYAQFANESVLEALIRVAEQTGEHFILSPSGRQVLWLRNDIRSSGMRAIAPSDTLGAEANRDIALIQSLTEAQTGYDLISRVYPYGGGLGTERATLANCTRSAPPGYTLDKVNNCLINTTAEALYGRIDRRLDFPDVVTIANNVAQQQYASNALFDKAYVYLRRRSATNLDIDGGDAPRTYDVTLLKCDRVLLPGYTLRIEYDRYTDGGRRYHVNGDLWILSSTVRADSSGVHTVALQCSTTDVAPMTDADLTAELLRRQRAMMAHAPGV